MAVTRRTADLVTMHLRLHLEALAKQDARLRLDKPSAVNNMRIEARRLRSTLTTYQVVFAPGSVELLCDELRWVGGALGAARDAQVLRVRLAALVAAEPDDLHLGTLGRRIDERLRRAYLDGRAEGLAALASDRYRILVDTLTWFLDDPPFSADAALPAQEVVPPALERDRRRLKRAVRNARHAVIGDERDAAFHLARRRAKQLRYAAESAVPLFDRATEVVRAAEQIQDVLGERQDAAIARALLREYAAEVGLEDLGSTLDKLQAIEERRRDEHEAAFLQLWKQKGFVSTLRA